MNFDGILGGKEVPRTRKLKSAVQEMEQQPPQETTEPQGTDGSGLDMVAGFKSTVPTVVEYADKLISSARALDIKSADDDKTAVELVLASKKSITTLESRKKGYEPFIKARLIVDSVNSFVRATSEKFATVEQLIKPKREQYRRLQEVERQRKEQEERERAEKLRKELADKVAAEQKALDESAAALGKVAEKIIAPEVPEVMIPKETAPVRTDVGAAHERMKWVAEIINPDAVPREFCSPDQEKIDRAMKEGAREISGVNIREKTIDVYRGA